MMARGHAMGGAAVWLTGWSWVTVAGIAKPSVGVLTIGTLACAGAALVPDLDHRKARLAQSAGWVSEGFAIGVGWLGARIHAATKLSADRPDHDGHRTITHTAVFALFVGLLTHGVVGLVDNLGGWAAAKSGLPIEFLGTLPVTLLVFAFVQLGAATLRSNWGGRRRKVALLPPKGRSKRGRGRVHKSTAFGLAAALATPMLVSDDMWWFGLAIGIGCFAHCLGDLITIGGCPILWPIPIGRRELVYDRKQRQKVPVFRWRTWYLVGTPQWMRFAVNGKAEQVVTWGLFVWCWVAAAGLVYAFAAGPAAG